MYASLVPLSLREDFEAADPRKTSPLFSDRAKVVVTAWSWAFFALDLIFPTLFYFGLVLGFHAAGSTNTVAVRDFFVLRLSFAALTMGHLKLITHSDGNTPQWQMRLRALGVTLGILGTGAFTLLVGYLLVLNGSFGSAGDSAADLDTSSAAVPGFGYVEDCITGSNRLVDADDCTVLSNFCFDLSSAAQGVTQGAVRPPLRRDCTHAVYLPTTMKSQDANVTLVPYLSYFLQQHRAAAASTEMSSWGRAVANMLSARWMWQEEFWKAHWAGA